jgi:hypothetical protein
MSLIKEDKMKIFKEELQLIESENLRVFCELVLAGLPDYFFTAPASSSGKYHPEFSNGEGGLVRHTKMVVQVVEELLFLKQYQSVNRDLVIVAAILHDGVKLGLNGKGTDPMHPDLMAAVILNTEFEMPWIQKKIIAEMIRCHMGQWGKYKPIFPGQKLLHMADYIASRKFFDMAKGN